jgi:hypothetical protein
MAGRSGRIEVTIAGNTEKLFNRSIVVNRIVLAFFVAVFVSPAFGAIKNFNQATKDMKPLPVSAKQCRVQVDDKVSGMSVDSNDFEPVIDQNRPDVKYLSVYKNGLTPDGSTFFTSVVPFAGDDGKILMHIIMDAEAADYAMSGRMEIVELIGEQISANQLAFHGWSNNKFDFRDRGQQFDTVGTIENGRFVLNGETAELKYSLTCQF